MKNYTRSAIGVLTRQYSSILKKCFLINLGLFALNCPANAATTVTTYDALRSALAASTSANVILDTNGSGIALTGAPGINIKSGQTVVIQNVGTKGETAWTETNGTVKQVSNSGNLSIDNVYYNNNVVRAEGSWIYNMGHITAITDSEVKDNQTNSSDSAGGIIYNTANGSIDLIKNVNFINNAAISRNSSSVFGKIYGGVISNYGNIGNIESNFTNNYVDGNCSTSSYNGSVGGAITNGNNGSIQNIIGDFNGNYAYADASSPAAGGAVYLDGTVNDIIGNFNNNYSYANYARALGGAIDIIGNINSISGDFNGNYAKSDASAEVQGGAILLGRQSGSSHNPIIKKSLEGNFTSNYALSKGQASGGAISSNYYSQINEGIKGDFSNNYAKSTGTNALARGGAILSFGYIKSIDGDFSDNYAESSGTGAIGGAMALLSNTTSSQIDTLTSTFSNNRAVATGSGYARGGAIYSMEDTEISEIKDSTFTGNYAKTANSASYAEGGAIYNKGNISFSGENNFSDNYTEVASVKTANDIYNSGTITLNADSTLNINSGINGNDGAIQMNSGSVLNMDAAISDNTITADSSEIYVKENGSFGDNVTLNINEGSLLSIEPIRITVSGATFAVGSTLSLKVTDLEQAGVLYAENLSIAPDEQATIKINVAQGILKKGKTADVQVLKADNEFENTFKDEITINKMYSFAKKENAAGWYTITQNTTAAEIVEEQGGTQTEIDAAGAWVDGDEFTDGTTSAEIADALSDLAQNNDPSLVKNLSVIVPMQTPMVSAISTEINDKLLLAVENHLSGNNTGEINSGNVLKDITIWTKAYYGKSEFSDSGNIKGFDTKNKGIIIGADKKLDNGIKVGGGLHYNDGDIDAYSRNIEADTLVGYIYGEYRPSEWFVNGVASFGKTDYKEKKYALGHTIKDKYDADVYSMQAISGYDFKYFTPETGARYYHIKRHGYTDNIGQNVEADNIDILRAVLGVRTSYRYDIFKPELYAGITYDIVSDRENALVSLPNGSSYTARTKKLSRFGTEISGLISAYLADNASVGIGYEGKFREHYKDNTGIISAKYIF